MAVRNGDGGTAKCKKRASVRIPLKVVVVAMIAAVTAVAAPLPASAADTTLELLDNQVGQVADVAVDPSGHIIYADALSSTVYRYNTDADTTEVVAGTGSSGFSGDGGPANLAMLNQPNHLAIDAAGNIFVADNGNFRIRRIDAATGVIATVLGSGVPEPSSPNVNAPAASPGRIDDMTVDSDTLWFLSTGYGFIRSVDLSTGVIRQVAGTGELGKETVGIAATTSRINAGSVAVDADGNVFFAGTLDGSRTSNLIYRVDAVTGILTLVAGNGQRGNGGDYRNALASPLQDIASIAIDPQGFLYLASQDRIRRVDPNSGVITTIVWPEMPSVEHLEGVSYFAVGEIAAGADGSIGFFDPSVRHLRRLANAAQASSAVVLPLAPGEIVTELGGPSLFLERRIPGVQPGDYYAQPVTFDRDGNLFLAFQSQSLTIDMQTGERRLFSADFAPGARPLYNTLATGPDGDIFIGTSDPRLDWSYIDRVDASSGQARRIAGKSSSSLIATGDGGPAIDALLRLPNKVVIDRDGNVLFVELDQHRIRRIDEKTGIISTIAGTGVSGFGGDGGPALSAQLNYPHSLALEADGSILIADTGNHRIRRIDAATGLISTIVGDGTVNTSGDGGPALSAQLGAPTAIAIDGAGNIFVAEVSRRSFLLYGDWFEIEGSADVIRRIDAATGTISTIAGSIGFGDGQGGPNHATRARLDLVSDLLVDHEGDLWITERSRVRRIEQAGVPVPLLDFEAPAMCAGFEVTIDIEDGDVPTYRDDVIRGTMGPDVIDGLEGNDIICGLGGDDVLTGSLGADKIYAGAGDDKLIGGSANDRLVGGPGRDELRGEAGNDRLLGGGGRDVLYGGPGKDRLAGGTGNDILHGEGNADQLFGNQGRDVLQGGPGADVLRGGSWIDQMNGGADFDACAIVDGEGRINCERGVFGLR